jgi:hypothetical protein
MSKLKRSYHITPFYRGGQAFGVVIFATPPPLKVVSRFVIYITKKPHMADFDSYSTKARAHFLFNWWAMRDSNLRPRHYQ